MTDAPRITALSWLMIATLGLTWGGTFLVTEIALTGMPPFWLAAARVTFGALLMAVIWSAMGFPLFKDPPTAGSRARLALIGLLSSALPFALLAWGQQHVTSGFAGVAMAAIALIVLPLAHFTLPGERMNLRKIMGFCIGFCGVLVLIGAQAFESTGGAFENLGRIACIAAAACYAVGSILLRKLPEAHPIGLASVLLLIGACYSVPLALIAEGLPPLPSAQILGVLVFLGLIPTAAANFLRVLVVRGAGPVFMSLVNYQVPVWSVVLGALILSEPLPPALLLAMALILTGVGISQLNALNRLLRKGQATR